MDTGVLQEKSQKCRDGEKDGNNNRDIEQDFFSASFYVKSAAFSSAKGAPDSRFRPLKKNKDD